MQIDPQRRGKLPPVGAAVPLNREDGTHCGWRIDIPGGRPLATPAVVDGRVFIGGGFGSYEFYCLDAASGKLLWQYQTSDDGPTAAVVADGHVAFNTESCEMEVLTVAGDPVWKHWLGDPLMSMPAVADGKVFMAYPDSRGDHKYYFACFELTTGKRIWQTKITGEIITAPVLADDAVYFATLDGSLFCCDQSDGTIRWREMNKATTSPVVVDGHCYFSQREAVRSKETPTHVQQTEHCACRATRAEADTRPYRSTSRKADYLDYRKRSTSSPRFAHMHAHDAAVGFAASKGSSNIEQAMEHLGHGNVAGIWAYQGSKPFYRYGRLYASLGDGVSCVAPDADDLVWSSRLHGDGSTEPVDSVITPPALVNGKVFVGTESGKLLALSAESGNVMWQHAIDTPVNFQVTVVAGRVYVPTRTGRLFCVETGDDRDDGWAMWGATPAHNGLTEADCDIAV